MKSIKTKRASDIHEYMCTVQCTHYYVVYVRQSCENTMIVVGLFVFAHLKSESVCIFLHVGVRKRETEKNIERGGIECSPYL